MNTEQTSDLSIITDNLVIFHDKPDGIQYESSSHHFGVFFLEVAKTEMTQNAQYIMNENDMSGSMEQENKMQELHLTLNNIVNLLSKNADNVDVTLEISGFDSDIEQVIPSTKIQKDLNQLIQIQRSIKHILQPRGSTDIGLALEDATNKCNLQTEIKSKHMIFMTDGLITSGVHDYDELKTNVPQNSRNYFIGFGADHDFHLLQHLASVNSGQYYYVDNIENAGLVFGEIIHSILYTAIEDFTIKVNGGEIYDFQTNTWTTELKLPVLCGEAKKQFHLRSENPDDFELTYSGVNIHTGKEFSDTQIQLPNLMDMDMDNVTDVHDLSKYICRQKTLELLAEVSNLSLERMKNNTLDTAKISEMKMKLQEFRKKLEEYKSACANEEDKEFIKQLCDDLFISEKTIYSNRSLLYTVARQSSQGRGCSHNITKIETCDFMDEEDYEILDTPVNLRNSSDTQQQIMRGCSNRM